MNSKFSIILEMYDIFCVIFDAFVVHITTAIKYDGSAEDEKIPLMVKNFNYLLKPR